jgi:aldehyde:ferredoxin oxidoreductase
VRNGVGAIWGSKGLKAVVVDDQTGQRPDMTDPAAYKDLLRAVRDPSSSGID